MQTLTARMSTFEALLETVRPASASAASLCRKGALFWKRIGMYRCTRAKPFWQQRNVRSSAEDAYAPAKHRPLRRTRRNGKTYFNEFGIVAAKVGTALAGRELGKT